MADFDLIGRVQLELDPQTLARIERDMERVARSANKTLTTGFDAQRRGSARELRTNILQRDKFASQQGSRANLEITRRETKELEKQAQALKENILLRDKFVSFQASRANAEITRRETDQIDRQSAALRENILLRDRFVSTEAAKGNAAIVANETEQIKKQSDALRENILLRDRFITQQASRFNEIVTADTDTADAKRASSLKNNILQRDAFIAEQAARQNAEITRSEDANNKKRIDSLRNAILERAKLNKQLESQRRLSPLQNDPAFQFGQQSALAFRRFAAFSIAAGGLFTVVQTMREGISEAIKFEQQLVKLAQVSNTSVSALGNFRETIDGLSVGLGVSSSDLVQSAVTIRQAGFTLAETKAALDTLALTSLSPSFNDLKNTTEGLIALKSQFGTSADAFKREFGEINSVSKAFAVESEDIVTAIRKSGGAFKVAGGQVRDLIALFTAVRSTTRESADTIATGFRTIFARLQRPQIIDELKQFNIELRDSEGNFVGPLKAIEEINKALGDIGSSGDLQFSRIVEQIGGIRQISKVVPLIQQFATAQRAANIALLGQNSLAEDAEIAQQSLANRITKTKENFLQFARELTINDQFKQLISGLLSVTDAFTNFGKAIAPLLPSLALVFGLSKLGAGSRFLQGFGNRLQGRQDFFGQRQFAQSTAGVLPFLGRRGRLRLGASLPALGILGGFALSEAGAALSDTSPLTNRRQFLAGRAASTGGAGLASGIIGGGALGTAFGGPGIGTAIGAALGLAGGALLGFTNAVKDAQDALEESQFRPRIDTLAQSLSLVNAGRISPLGQRDHLLSGFNALRERRLTATGVERDQLNGDIRQTVESLLQFIQVLQESSKTMDDFNAAGGDEAIKFIAENSILSGKRLTDQTERTILALEKAKNATRNLAVSQEKLTSQANLIGSFGAALADATAKANDMSERFNFVSTNLLGAGAVGVQFRGVPGLQDIFSRPGQIANLDLLGNAANQATGFLGPQFTGLGQQAIATSDILRQLPSILSEFAIRRPSGDIAESLDVFVRDRLNQIAKNIPAGGISLEPIIDGIASSITSEISKQGSGQADAIQKILDAPATFVQGIVSGGGFEPLFQLFQDATTRFTERFNNYSDQFAQLTSREIQLRQQLVENLGVFFGRLEQVERIRNPRQFPIGALRAGRLAQQQALLGPNAALAGNPDAILAQRRGIQPAILDKEAALQKSTEVEATRGLIEEIIKLQGESDALARAFDLAADQSDEIANKFDQIERIQLGRDQRRQGAGEFIFGDRAARNQLNLVTAATQLAALNPDNFFNPNVIADSLRPAIGDFLDKFSELQIIPGLTGRQLRERLLEQGARRGVLNPQFLDDLKEGPNAAQQKLLDEIKALAEQELKDRGKFIQDERNNITLLVTGINHSLQAFIQELRTTLLQQQQVATQNRLQSVQAQQSPLQKQIAQFAEVQALGGSNVGRQNLKSLELAKTFRSLQGRNTAIVRTLGDVNALTKLDGQKLINRFRGNLGFSNLINTLSLQDIPPKFTKGGTVFDPSLNVVQAENLLLPALTSVFADLKLSRGVQQNFRNQVSDRLGDAANTSGNVRVVAIKDIVISLLKEAAETARKEASGLRGPAIEQFEGLADDQQAFIRALVDLPADKFNELSKAINELGDAKLDKVTEQFNNLNREAAALAGTLQGLTNQIRGINPQPGGGGGAIGPPAAAPQMQPLFDVLEATRQMLRQMTDDLKGAVNGKNGISQAIQGIPRNIELAANHKVEVIINGAQVLAQLQPGLEQLVITETEKAINKFAANNLPGVGSFA